MRVHLGCDHAGLDLKDHLTAWLTDHGYEPVDHGPFGYDAVDDYPVFCLRAAEGGRRRPRRGLDSLGVVIGGSGNGEQIAANKVAGIRCALAWSEETAQLARQHNDANVVSVGGRMHSLEDMTRFVELFLADAVQRRRAARSAGSASSTAYERTRELPPLPASPGRRQRCLRATPSTGSPPRSTATFARPGRSGRAARRAGSPTRRRCVDGQVLVGAEAWGKHLFVEFPDDRFVHVHLGLYGKFDVHADVAGGAAAGRPGPAPAGPADATARVRRPARRHRLRAADPRASATPSSPGSARTRCATTPTPTCAWERIRRSKAPIGGLLMDQTVVAGVGNVYRAELLFRHRIDPFRPGQHACGSGSGRRCGTTWSC